MVVHASSLACHASPSLSPLPDFISLHCHDHAAAIQEGLTIVRITWSHNPQSPATMITLRLGSSNEAVRRVRLMAE